MSLTYKHGHGLTQIFAQLNSLKSTTKAKFLFLWTGKFDGNNLLSDLDSSVITVTGKDFATKYIPASSAATFSIPDSATYKTADEDLFWSNGTNVLEKTTAQLVAYDYTRTVIKYNDSAPYDIEAIGLLKTEEVLTSDEIDEIHRYFRLWIYWSNILNAFGVIKTNRVITSIPLFVSAEITDREPTKVKIFYDQLIRPTSIPAPSDFILAGKTIDSVSIDGNIVILTVTIAYNLGDTVAVSYSKPLINYIRPVYNGLPAESFTNSPVTNNSFYPSKIINGQFTNSDYWNIGSAWSIGEDKASYNKTVNGSPLLQLQSDMRGAISIYGNYTVKFRVISGSAQLAVLNYNRTRTYVVLTTYAVGSYSLNFSISGAGPDDGGLALVGYNASIFAIDDVQLINQ
jgi:hypothetical protein